MVVGEVTIIKMIELNEDNLSKALDKFVAVGKWPRKLHVSSRAWWKAEECLRCPSGIPPRTNNTSDSDPRAVELVLHFERDDDWWLLE